MKEKDNNSEDDFELTEQEIEYLKIYDAFDPAQTIESIEEAGDYSMMVKDTLEETDPSNEVLIEHLENKKEWVCYLLDWFDDEAIKHRLARFDHWKNSWEKTWGRKRKKIYLVKSHAHEMVKIGYSVNPQARVKTLAGDQPMLELIHVFEGREQDEKRLHQKYNNKRVKGEGEWFRLTDEDIENIEEHFKSSNEGDLDSFLKPSSFDQYTGTDGWRVVKDPYNGVIINGCYN